MTQSMMLSVVTGDLFAEAELRTGNNRSGSSTRTNLHPRSAILPLYG